jgi:hypothetical protein
MMADKALLGTGIFAKKADSITCEAEFIMIELRKLRWKGYSYICKENYC